MRVNRITVEEWSLWRELRLQALEEAPYAFGSTLADWQREGDQEQRWRLRLESVDFNAIATLEGRNAGMVSGVLGNQRVELISMWVAPFARGRKVGDALVDSVIQWAEELNITSVELSVKEDNILAIALYTRHGFADAGINNRDDNLGIPERLMARS
ncbi:MAG TPA: GNAT family N-acetyltransferase [Acidimicrobiales bacterium]|nr:GNAT family N-acetyltransferase [Acidimicrobiales bacterium]